MLNERGDRGSCSFAHRTRVWILYSSDLTMGCRSDFQMIFYKRINVYCMYYFLVCFCPFQTIVKSDRQLGIPFLIYVISSAAELRLLHTHTHTICCSFKNFAYNASGKLRKYKSHSVQVQNHDQYGNCERHPQKVLLITIVSSTLDWKIGTPGCAPQTLVNGHSYLGKVSCFFFCLRKEGARC